MVFKLPSGKTWSLSSLFGRHIEKKCPLSSSSFIYFDKYLHKDAHLHPEPHFIENKQFLSSNVELLVYKLNNSKSNQFILLLDYFTYMYIVFLGDIKVSLKNKNYCQGDR